MELHSTVPTLTEPPQIKSSTTICCSRSTR